MVVVFYILFCFRWREFCDDSFIISSLLILCRLSFDRNLNLIRKSQNQQLVQCTSYLIAMNVHAYYCNCLYLTIQSFHWIFHVTIFMYTLASVCEEESFFSELVCLMMHAVSKRKCRGGAGVWGLLTPKLWCTNHCNNNSNGVFWISNADNNIILQQLKNDSLAAQPNNKLKYNIQ
jgi:hypothetical protein